MWKCVSGHVYLSSNAVHGPHRRKGLNGEVHLFAVD
jgi:hypothetical protein